jgi:hypothetical protein
MFPDSLESKIIREFKTDVPTQSYQHTKKSSMTVYRNRLRLTAVMNSVNLMFLFVIGHVVALPISSLDRCFFDIISWVVIGYSVFFQAVLFQDNILVAVLVYVSLVVAVGTFIYYYYKSACRLRRSGKRAGVISIRSIYEKEKIQKNVSRLVSPQQQIMSGVVEKLRNHTQNRYSPRFERIMGALKSAAMDVDDKDKESGLGFTYDQKPPESSRTLSQAVSSECNTQVAINFDIASSSDNGHVEDDENNNNTESVNNMKIKTMAFKKMLQEDLGLDLSDDSDDSYEDDLEGEFSFEFSSDSTDHECDGSQRRVSVMSASFGCGPNMATDAKFDSSQQQDLLRVFTKPKSVKSLAHRIRKNRDGIKKISLTRQAQEISDSFVYNTEARRTSTLVARARAQSKLQQRIEQKKILGLESDVASSVEKSCSDVIETDEGIKNNNFVVGKLNSFEIYDEKKSILTNFAAHDKLYRHKRLGHQLEAKASLEQRRTSLRDKT